MSDMQNILWTISHNANNRQYKSTYIMWFDKTSLPATDSQFHTSSKPEVVYRYILLWAAAQQKD